MASESQDASFFHFSPEEVNSAWDILEIVFQDAKATNLPLVPRAAKVSSCLTPAAKCAHTQAHRPTKRLIFLNQMHSVDKEPIRPFHPGLVSKISRQQGAGLLHSPSPGQSRDVG